MSNYKIRLSRPRLGDRRPYRPADKDTALCLTIMRSLERANMLRVIIILRNGPMSLTEVYGCIRAPGVGRERLRVLQEMNVVHLTKDGKVTLAQLTPVGKEVAERLSEIGRSIGRLNRY